jgi:hypothetical protein
MPLICVRTKAEYFCKGGWTGFWVICPLGTYNILRPSRMAASAPTEADIVLSLAHQPIVPDSLREWREAVEYALSIMLAIVIGNLLALLILRSLGRPSAVRRSGGNGRRVDLHRTKGRVGALIGRARGFNSRSGIPIWLSWHNGNHRPRGNRRRPRMSCA